MKKYRLLFGAALAALLLFLPACRAIPDSPYSQPAGLDNPALDSSGQTEGMNPPSVGQESSASPAAQPNPADASSQPAGSSSRAEPLGPMESSQPNAPSSGHASSPVRPETSSSGREGTGLLKGKEAGLLDWQWVDAGHLAIAAYYADTNETLILLYSLENPAIQKLAHFGGRPQNVSASLYEDQVEFLLDEHSLTIDRKDQELATGLSEDHSDLLPEADAEYGYGGVALSSSRKYFFYERFPSEFGGKKDPVSDRIFIQQLSAGAGHSPSGEIAFPFDVRITPKAARWMQGNDRLLVEADVPQKDQYDTCRRTYYVYGTSAKQLACFQMEENDLSIRDTYRSLILFERAGEPYELLCYDYLSKKRQTVVRLEGENRSFATARFSPDGSQIAVLRTKTDLTPQFYPVPEMG